MRWRARHCSQKACAAYGRILLRQQAGDGRDESPGQIEHRAKHVEREGGYAYYSVLVECHHRPLMNSNSSSSSSTVGMCSRRSVASNPFGPVEVGRQRALANNGVGIGAAALVIQVAVAPVHMPDQLRLGQERHQDVGALLFGEKVGMGTGVARVQAKGDVLPVYILASAYPLLGRNAEVSIPVRPVHPVPGHVVGDVRPMSDVVLQNDLFATLGREGSYLHDGVDHQPVVALLTVELGVLYPSFGGEVDVYLPQPWKPAHCVHVGQVLADRDLAEVVGGRYVEPHSVLPGWRVATYEDADERRHLLETHIGVRFGGQPQTLQDL